MKLVDKKTVVEQKSSERTREVQEGLKLAKSIDSLRKTYSEEQVKLNRFRDETLREIKKEVQIEKDKLLSIQNDPEMIARKKIEEQTIAKFKSEQIQIDNDRKANQTLRFELLEREPNLILRESTVQASELKIFEREEHIKESENTAKHFLEEAQKEFELAEISRVQAEKIQFEKEKEVDERLRLLRSQQDELAYKERDLNIEKSQIEKEKLNIINEKIHIASQQQTLRVAWENIRKLQANK